MVATLIMFTAGRGIAQLITDGQITYVRVDSYRLLGASFPGIPIPTPFYCCRHYGSIYGIAAK